MREFIDLIAAVDQGYSSCIIGRELRSSNYKIGQGTLFTRGFSEYALLAIRVDTVVFLGQVPSDVEVRGHHLVRTSLSPRVMYWEN